MKHEFKKLVVVTGVSGGLGSSIVQTLLDANFEVIGVSRREPKLNLTENQKSSFTFIAHDLAEIDNLPKLVKKIKESKKNIYGLVNNAAIGKDGILPTIHNRDIHYQITLNLTSPIILTKYLCREMLLAREGRIINISSIIANSGYRGLSVYAATKGGLESFTRSLARELGTYGITVNCIAPGFMVTEMTSTLSVKDLERIKNRSALKRFPSVLEVSSSVKYLLAEESTGITGSVITVDAGNTA